jgi:hypothetical protein
MPPRDGFATNASRPGQYLVQTRARTSRPYASTGSYSNLTYKEKLARSQISLWHGSRGCWVRGEHHVVPRV